MDYNILLDVTTQIGYRLAMSGAETFRVEESIRRIMDAYGIKSEVFAIPNCLIVSIQTAQGEPMTRMRRIGHHGNDLDCVEKYNALSRRICREQPHPAQAAQWLQETNALCKHYPVWSELLGGFLGAGGFSILFGGGLNESLCAGICGIAACAVNRFMDSMKVNPFFRTIASSFLTALLAYFAGAFNLCSRTDAVVIGTLMILLPGLVFTNAMRDIIYGDTNSGINRIVQVLLTAAAIALGTGAAWSLAETLFGITTSAAVISHSLWAEAAACLVCCTGFTVLFNIHGQGSILCALGGMLTWVAYRLILQLCGNDITAYFFATMIAASYSETMARVRKYPALSYLLISIFPLLPGAGVYYTTSHIIHGNMESFVSEGLHTVCIAGVMAVGILLISTLFRLKSVWLQRKCA